MMNNLKQTRHKLYHWSMLLLLILPLHVSLAESIDEMETHPELSDLPPAAVLPELPPLPALPEDKNRLSTLDKVYVKVFKFEGNTVFSDDELTKITKDYTGREISAEELQEVKNVITKYYVDAGYINSGAIIPDQTIGSRVITLEIVEGKLIKVDVSGNEKVRMNYIKKRLEDEEGSALDINELQTRLQRVQQNPLFRRINAELGPGVNLGEAILTIQVEEARPYQFGFAFDNHRSPSIGAYRGEITAEHRNLTGWGDKLYARYGITEGLDDYMLEYSFPITSGDTTLSISAERSESQVIEQPFEQLNIGSDADTYGISLRHPFRWGIEKELGVGVKLEKRQSKTFLLGGAYPFSPCTITEGKEGESNITMLRFFQDWLDRDRNHVIAARSSFSFEMDGLGDSVNECERIVTWLGQFQWVQRMDFELFKDYEMLRSSQAIFRTDLQWAKNDLIPLEKVSIGGASTVRGYRENLLTRDNGFITSLEWRIPLVRLPIPKISGTDDGWLKIAPFVDYGRAWNADSETPDPKDIYSVGIGLRWAPSQKINTELYWGAALRDIPDPEDDDLQDKGVHFGITVEF